MSHALCPAIKYVVSNSLIYFGFVVIGRANHVIFSLCSSSSHTISQESQNALIHVYYISSRLIYYSYVRYGQMSVKRKSEKRHRVRHQLYAHFGFRSAFAHHVGLGFRSNFRRKSEKRHRVGHQLYAHFGFRSAFAHHVGLGFNPDRNL